VGDDFSDPVGLPGHRIILACASHAAASPRNPSSAVQGLCSPERRTSTGNRDIGASPCLAAVPRAGHLSPARRAAATGEIWVVLFGRSWQESAGLVLWLRINMAQHFLLSAAARSLSPAKIMRMSDNGVENVFLRLRWPDTICLRSSPSATRSKALCQEDVKASCCTRDEGGPFGAVL
jgi:hypothetical protein